MKSTFEDYSSKQNVWKTYGDNPLQEKENRLAEEYIVIPFKSGCNPRILEAGTGSGRISFRIKEKADIYIDAFDLLPSFIEQAEKNKVKSGLDIHFYVKDAVNLAGFTDNGYDVLIYLQQILSIIPKSELHSALSECARVCKPGGLLILSYANYDGRGADRLLSSLLSVIRFFRKDSLSSQELPHLHTNNKKGKRVINLSYLGSNQSIVYWFRKIEIEDALFAAGFDVIRRLDEDRRITFLVCKKHL